MSNRTATAIKVLAWLTLVGGSVIWLLSFIADFYGALPYLGVAIAGFILLRGFAEVISLLDKISKNTQPTFSNADLLRVFAEIISLLDKINMNTQPSPENTDEEQSKGDIA
ncbi:MAG: hypothetical protein FWE98_02255 [Oscillospiraceae bacterium]|nr:hypothetical protein [Oscillospiraceae bacterium]